MEREKIVVGEEFFGFVLMVFVGGAEFGLHCFCIRGKNLFYKQFLIHCLLHCCAFDVYGQCFGFLAHLYVSLVHYGDSSLF